MPDVKDDFWPRVFSSAPTEIDEYILSSDATILGETLVGLNVERFELDAQGNGEPRSLRFTFEFKTGDENPFFTNQKLVKEFYWRQEISKSASGRTRTWAGLVSEPVRINWKKDADPTSGLLDAACDLAEAEKKKGGDRTKLPEYAALVKKIEEAEAEAANAEDEDADEEDMPSPVGVSFFGFFGYRGRDVSAAKSQESTKEIDARWAKVQNGEDIDEAGDSDDEDDEEEEGLEEIEIFDDGDDLAVGIAEDLWTDALNYYGK